MFGFYNLKWYGLRRPGTNNNGKPSKVIEDIQRSKAPPTKQSFYDNGIAPHPEDEIVELKLVVTKTFKDS